MLTESFMTLMNASSNVSHRKRTENAIKEKKRAATLSWIDRKRFIFLIKHVRRQNGALVSFIGHKGTADWLLARILKWIADRLILYSNHRSIDRTKLLVECFQKYEGCLSAEINQKSHNLVKNMSHESTNGGPIECK